MLSCVNRWRQCYLLLLCVESLHWVLHAVVQPESTSKQEHTPERRCAASGPPNSAREAACKAAVSSRREARGHQRRVPRGKSAAAVQQPADLPQAPRAGRRHLALTSHPQSSARGSETLKKHLFHNSSYISTTKPLKLSQCVILIMCSWFSNLCLYSQLYSPYIYIYIYYITILLLFKIK